VPLPDSLVNQIRVNVLRAIATTPGTQKCVIRPVTNNSFNIYGDSVDPDYAEQFEHFCYIEFNPPIKVVKELGWWKAGESLPIVCYVPYSEEWTPATGDIVTVDADEGYMAGNYKILQVKTFGQGAPLVWVVNLEPERA